MTINTYLHGPHMSDGRKSWEVAYSWELQARPVDPSTIVPAPVSNNNLSILNANHTEATQVNNTLYGLDDWGVILVIADVNMYRYMEEQGWNWEFDRLNSTGTFANWCYKWSPACQHLVDVWAHSCIHPYLNNQIHDTHPISHRDHTLTIATATNMYRDEPIKWLPCPWYHDEDQPGNTPLHVVNPHVCPYCHLELHHGCTCLHPYALCGDWASCDVPSTHLAYAGGCLLISAEHT